MLLAMQAEAALRETPPYVSWIISPGVRVSGLILALTALLGVSLGLPLFSWLSLSLAAWLAAENGGNDVSKGIAPLVSGGLVNIKVALMFGSIVTLVGSFVSFWVASGLIKLFSTGLIQAGYTVDSVMTFCTVAGAALFIAFATRYSLPVSTTHALVGALVLVVIYTHGAGGVAWVPLLQKVLLPLIILPPIALFVASIVNRLLIPYGLGKSLGRTGLWLSCGGICLMRAVNDTPKIAAVAALSLTMFHVSLFDGTALSFIVVSIAMFLGSYLKGCSVTETLALRLARNERSCCVAAPSTTIALIFLASRFGIPVSTTHLSTCSIIGCNVGNGSGLIDTRILKQILMSWVFTVPLSGIFGVLLLFFAQVVGRYL